jgi:hypothetical protein
MEVEFNSRSCTSFFETTRQPLPLTEMFEQFEPMAVAECLGDLGKADQDTLFRTEA